MRGRLYDLEARQAARRQWAETLVPRCMAGEVRPLMPLLSRHDGLVLVDVGANKGCWTKAFLNVFGARFGHAHMVEPSPENHHELLDRVDNMVFDPADAALISALPAGFRRAAGRGHAACG